MKMPLYDGQLGQGLSKTYHIHTRQDVTYNIVKYFEQKEPISASIWKLIVTPSKLAVAAPVPQPKTF